MKQGYSRILTFLSAVLLALGLVMVSQVSAQMISGDLVGTVLDKTGAVVPNASIEAVNVETGIKYTAEANDTGEYRFNNLPVGTYNVSASAANFATTMVNGFRLELNKTSTLQITLEVKGTVATIEVSGVTQALDTTTATVANTFDEKAMADLPSAQQGLGVLNLSLLASGVASSGGVGAGTGPSVGGQRPRNNNFTIEGVDNNSKGVTGPLVYVPNDAVAEFSVLQNQYSPEFGHSSGGQFNQVVKSGTNSLHGAAYIYSQNRNFNAIDQATANQGFKQNQRFDNNRMGATVGGPILKNKLFFFGNLEYNPVGQAGVSSAANCTPTSAGYTTLGTISGLSQTNLQIFQKYATASPAIDPNVPSTFCAPATPVFGDPANPTKQTDSVVNVNGTNVQVGTLPVAAPSYVNYWAGVGSIDYNISSKDQLRGRYIYNRGDGIDNAAALPAFFLPLPNRYHLITVNEYHTFTPNVTNEFRIGFNRYFNETPAGNFKFPGLDSFPNLSFDELGGLSIGPDGNAPQFGIQNLYQVADSISVTRGSRLSTGTRTITGALNRTLL